VPRPPPLFRARGIGLGVRAHWRRARLYTCHTGGCALYRVVRLKNGLAKRKHRRGCFFFLELLTSTGRRRSRLGLCGGTLGSNAFWLLVSHFDRIAFTEHQIPGTACLAGPGELDETVAQNDVC
jgi:hypothetical protein